MTASKKQKAKKRPQCGTNAGYRAHMRHGELTCKKCRVAHRDTLAQYRKNGPSETSPQARQRRRTADEQLGIAILDQIEQREHQVKAAKQEKAIKLQEKRKQAQVEVVERELEDADDGYDYPRFLRAGGKKLWRDVMDNYDIDSVGQVILTEACHMRDRADRFSAALAANSTLWFELGDLEERADGKEQIQVVVNSMISEARQTQAAMAVALAKIGVLTTAERKQAGESKFDQLAKRREERRAAALQKQQGELENG